MPMTTQRPLEPTTSRLPTESTTGRRPRGRLVITGVGVIAPTGIGVDAHWASVLGGELAVAPLEGFDLSGYPVSLGGQVRGFDPREHLDARLIVQTDRWSWMSLVATTMALRDAGYRPGDHDPYDTSVFLASGSGGNEFGQREIQTLWTRGPATVGAYQSIAWFYAASSGQISIRDGLKGHSGVVVSDAAGGLDSIGWARRVIRRGARAVLAGGTEAGLSPYALACQVTGGLLSTATDPRRGYKPFDVDACGYVLGEGGAVLLLEDGQAAASRGAAHIWAEVAGYAATHDGHHVNAAAPDARQYARAMAAALDDAGVSPDQVDLVVADGAGVPELDALEAAAIREVFRHRERPVPVTAPSGFTGRLLAGGSALNVCTALLAMRDGVVPAVGNLDRPVPGYRLDLVRSPRELAVDVVLVAARGYGGFNSGVVLRRDLEVSR
jgi:minimal PKS chain-length factor (CLF/KS beta)